MDLGLKDKIALITGAGSQTGFGKAICLLLAKEGCDIAASDINFEGCKKTASEVEALGRKALAVKYDITKKNDVKAMVKAALDKFGKIDILVNNAGGIANTEGPNIPYEDQEETEWDRDYNLNLKGAMLVTQAVFPHMVARKYGKIVIIAADLVKLVIPGVLMYAIAKSGIVRFARGLAKQLALSNSNINVNCISPGWSIETNFMKGGKEMKDAKAALLLPMTPLGRGTTVMDIANAVAFLASDVSGYITGQNISVSGGITMQ